MRVGAEWEKGALKINHMWSLAKRLINQDNGHTSQSEAHWIKHLQEVLFEESREWCFEPVTVENNLHVNINFIIKLSSLHVK